jgi:hypothetical protein
MSRLAKLIAKGFGIPGKTPTTHPGDHSPHSTHTPTDPNGIGMIDTDEHGWEERQLYAERGLTLAQAIYIFAPPNDSARYLASICDQLGIRSNTPLKDCLA